MATPAATALLSGKATAEDTKGLIKTVVDALNRDIVSFRFERDPKHYKKMRLVSVDVHVTTGLILGSAALALLWELGNWFAKGIAGWNGGSASNVPDAVGLLSLNPVLILLTDIFGNPVLNSSGQQKSVSVPPTFGATYNVMMRNLTAAGPGTLAQALLNMVGNATAGK